MSPRHFLDLDEVAPADIRAILESSKKRKSARVGLGQAGAPPPPTPTSRSRASFLP
jgi:ornithine carbamoyltransferase